MQLLVKPLYFRCDVVIIFREKAAMYCIVFQGLMSEHFDGHVGEGSYLIALLWLHNGRDSV